jgi:hypothetical protein
MVLNPNINITNAPYITLAVLAAVMAKKYTSPHGKSPFNIPSTKKLNNDFVCKSCLKSFVKYEFEEKECSSMVKNLIFPESDKPAKTIKRPANMRSKPFARLLNIATPPKNPNIAPSMVYVKIRPDE